LKKKKHTNKQEHERKEKLYKMQKIKKKRSKVNHFGGDILENEWLI
jgi:hypothetical protein